MSASLIFLAASQRESPSTKLAAEPEALAFPIAGMLQDGKRIPKPSKMDDLVADPARQDAVAFLVSADFPKSKTVRVNITARESQTELIDRRARQAGMTRSAYIVQSAIAEAAFNERGTSRRRPSRRTKV